MINVTNWITKVNALGYKASSTANSNYGTINVTVDNLFTLAFNTPGFPSTCGMLIINAYTLYKYQKPGTPYGSRSTVFTAEEITKVKTLLEIMFSPECCSAGGFVACMPASETPDYHFLRLAGFTPLAGWGNPQHGGRATHVWVKIVMQPKSGEKANILTPELTAKVNAKRVSLIQLLTEKESVETVPVVNVVKSPPVIKPVTIDYVPPVRLRDKKGRFLAKPVYNTAINSSASYR